MVRSYVLWLMVLCLAPCSTSKAQGPYHVWLTGWSDDCEKKVTEALLALDPHATVSVSTVTHSAVLASNGVFTKGMFEEVVSPYGFDILYATRTTSEGDNVPLDPEDLPFPVLQDTGDPDQDNADYDAAKAAWIAAYPDLYEAYKQGFFTNAPEE